MLRYFFIALGLFFVLLAAVAGFRGQKSGKPPIEGKWMITDLKTAPAAK